MTEFYVQVPVFLGKNKTKNPLTLCTVYLYTLSSSPLRLYNSGAPPTLGIPNSSLQTGNFSLLSKQNQLALLSYFPLQKINS